MCGCSEEVLIQDVVPCMPRGSLILVSLSSSSVPRMPIDIYIKKITEQQIYIYKKVRKGLDAKCDVPNANASLYSTKRIDQATHYHKSHHNR